MKVLLLIILSLTVYQTAAEIGDANYDLVKGVLDGKLQPVYDALLKKANPGFVMTADFLEEHKLSPPWIGFRSTPILHYAFGGGTEAYFRICSMLLAAGANPNLFAVDYPPAILFAFGYGKDKPNQDMAATIQEIFQNEKYRSIIHLDESLSGYNKLMNYTNNPGILEYSISNKFIHGAFALINSAQLDINAQNVDKVTALHYASFHGYTSFIDLFLTHPSISAWETDARGRIPLQYGILRGHMPVVQAFLNSSSLGKEDHKNMLMMRDDNGHSALDLALLPPVKVEIAKFLVSLHRSLGINVPTLPEELSTGKKVTAESSELDREKRSGSAEYTTAQGWRCSPYASALEAKQALPTNTVPTIKADELTQEVFVKEYLQTQRPVLIQSNLTATVNPAWSHLNRDEFINHFKNVKLFTVAGGASSTPTKITVKDWLTKLASQPQPVCSSQEDLSPDCQGSAKSGKAGAALAQSIPLRYLDAGNQLSKDFPLHPLFSMCSAFPESERFNYIQLNVGGYSSGEGAHAHGNSYEVQLVGRRKVVLIPSGALGPRDYSWGINSHVLEHYEQLLSFKEVGNVHEVIQYPGDVLFIPSGWVHASINFCDSVTVSTEFCSGIVDDMAGLKVPFNIHRQLYGASDGIRDDETSGRSNDEF